MSGIGFRLAVGVSLLLSVAGCRERGPTQGEGYAEVSGGRVWYRIVGSGGRTPLLVLHGGPGVPSYYLKPLAEPDRYVEVIRGFLRRVEAR